MVAGTIRYRVGNENSPADPWGRSELVIQPDGEARLDHHFSRWRGAGSWAGRVDAVAMDALWAALDLAGFPAAPDLRPVAGATLRDLAVEADGASVRAIIDWHQAPALSGYAEAFDLLDGVIRQLSGDSVGYPTTQRTIVRGIAAI
jgi:hypothetical protein